MSMLAERKRREKWSLNPRGKLWSEDQNKFGQRLMEKMGWKSGQGLGVNNQGATDIVKTRMKNDVKGLGFKDNGEEWLKKTSDFENLLEKLSSSQEDSGEDNQTETPTSLEEKSRKSRSRIHYHKFTRSKDVSRYSEKDLASIIGPDVIKLKNNQKLNKMDYTQNQVNKGSLEEYFSKKSKFQGSNSSGNTIADEVKETALISKDESRSFGENNENSNACPESEVVVRAKKNKRNKTDSDNNQGQVNKINEDVDFEVDQHYISKKKKNRKNWCDRENSTQEFEENDPDGLNSVSSKKIKKEKENNTKFTTEENEHEKKYSEIYESNNNMSKKRKIKHLCDIKTSACLENEKSQIESNNGEIVPKKKKRREEEGIIQTECNVESKGNEEAVLNDGISLKKKRSKVKKKEYQEDDESINHVHDIETSSCLENEKSQIESNNEEIVSKKKKRREEELGTVQTECNVESKSNEEAVLIGGVLSKKKKSKEKKKNHLEVDESINHVHNIETSSCLESEKSQIESNNEEIVPRKKKQREEEQGPVKTESNVESKINKEAELNDGILSKKKKRIDKNNELQEDDENNYPTFAEEALTDDGLTTKKKNKSSKENNKELQDGKYKNNNSVVAEKALVSDGIKSKKAKKQYKEANGNEEENSSNEKHPVTIYKDMKGKKEKQLNEEDICETAPESKQVSSNKSGDFLEVLGRRTRLKSIKIPCKTATKRCDDTYQTEEFMSFGSSDNSENKDIKKEKQLPQNINVYNDHIYIYRESNPFDCSIQKHVISYENKLVKAKLNKLNKVKKPSVIITDSKNLSKTNLKKLEELHRVRYYKSLLPEQDILQIDAAVKKFNKSAIKAIVDSPRSVDKISEILTHKEVEKEVANEKANSQHKCYAEINLGDCNIPKHVVTYEYRLVTERLKQLEKPIPDVKVVIKDALTLNETTRLKLKQISKIKHLKTLLPSNDLNEIETLVAKFYNDLKPKIEISTAIEKLEEHIIDMARKLVGKTDFKGNKEEDVPAKTLWSENVELLTKKIQQFEVLLDNFIKTKNESISSEGALEESYDAEEKNGTSSFLNRMAVQLDNLKEHMKILAEGKVPPDLNIISKSTRRKNKKLSPKLDSEVNKNKNLDQNTSSRGRIAYNVGYQRGRGRGVGRGLPATRGAVPFNWGRPYGSGLESQHFSSGFTDRGGLFGQRRGCFGPRRGFMSRGRGNLGDGGGLVGRGSGGFGDEESFTGQGRGGFSERRGFMRRGRGGFRGQGRGEYLTRGRGRISQNNFEAKLYAEKCKELNQLPEICFNGVNMKVISGYPANVRIDASNKDISQPTRNQQNPGGISEVDVK